MNKLEIDLSFYKLCHQIQDIGQCFEKLGHNLHYCQINSRTDLNIGNGHIQILYMESIANIESKRICHMLLSMGDRPENYQFMNNKALDICFWPCHAQELELRLRRISLAVSVKQSGKKIAWRERAPQLIGQSPAFINALSQLEQMAGSDRPVLIRGDTGTGKELVAHALHKLSRRATSTIADINCGALPEQLFENELFGHAQGAYTDARRAQQGIVAQAEGGSLFLDEIDALSQQSQRALLRFLQNGTYRPLGLGGKQRANVRIIVATNSNLEAEISKRRFRSDLYYRLNVFNILLPPLKTRREDIVILAKHFFKRMRDEYQEGPKYLHPLTIEAMNVYDWPGNVRELENFIEREYFLCEGLAIVADPSNKKIIREEKTPQPEHSTENSFQLAKQAAIDQFERDYLKTLLTWSAGNVSKAAKLAGKERRALGKLLKKHGIDRGLFKQTVASRT